VSADQDGVVKYWQPNFNNVKAIQAHHDPIRDLSFSPNDNKFVTACDDATLKIFDFAGGVEESMLTGHQWDAKTVDWHPTKGLLVSGSKDHQVKLWDPRTGRCLTTLHGHKNTVAKTMFEPLRGQLLATCARDQAARVFDLRMMRDICLLRGFEKDVTTLTWHPIHTNLLSTGGNDGSIYHYLLDEPNNPPGTVTTIPPYDTADPTNAPAQTIYPAHRIQHAHEYAVWSLDWHPLGHILASGSNDRVTRFWTRARPGEVDCFNDRYHLGDSMAEAVGTWDRRGGRRMLHEAEEQEFEDEAEGLVDQKMPARQPILPGIPGLPMPMAATKDGTSTGGAQVKAPPGLPASFPPPPFPGTLPPNFDPSKLAEMFKGGHLPPPPPLGVPGVPGHGLPPPPPNFDFSKMPPGMFPPGFQLPQGFPPPPVPSAGAGAPPGVGLPGIGDGNGGGAGAVRRRAPLPSQQESLMEEQRRGKYRVAR
jgi:polyadenylation factor subunit 2